MATTKKSAKNNKLKIGKSIRVNKWLALGFVAAVVASAITIVRYSGASGTVWSINSKAVSHVGGQTFTKTDGGGTYWAGKVSNSVSLNLGSAATYCIDGMYGENGSVAKVTLDNYSTSAASMTIFGDKGQKFTHCSTLTGKTGILVLEATRGTIVFYRFRTK